MSCNSGSFVVQEKSRLYGGHTKTFQPCFWPESILTHGAFHYPTRTQIFQFWLFLVRKVINLVLCNYVKK